MCLMKTYEIMNEYAIYAYVSKAKYSINLPSNIYIKKIHITKVQHIAMLIWQRYFALW